MAGLLQDLANILVPILKVDEGFSATPYYCPAGVLTIGYGETLGVRLGMVWTEEYAENRMRIRLRGFILSVLAACPRLVEEPLNRIAACVCLAYNIGTGAFSASSVARYTKAKQYRLAGDSFLLWNKSRGKVLRGLTLRRQRDRALYLAC
jgi:lysozyme